MGIGQAVAALRNGDRVARAGWNGKGMWLSLTTSREIPADWFWSPHNAEAARQNGGTLTVDAYVTMKTAQGTVVPWLCSQTDLLATDWEVIA